MLFELNSTKLRDGEVTQNGKKEKNSRKIVVSCFQLLNQIYLQ